MAEKVLCPWCGSEMELPNVIGIAFYICPGCSSTSPGLRGSTLKSAKEEAYAAAQRRSMQKPLALKSLYTLKNGDVIWVENIKYKKLRAAIIARNYNKICLDCISVELDRDGTVDRYYLYFERLGKWRCWARKPTDEERQNALWEEKIEV